LPAAAEIRLRPLVPDDLKLLIDWENNPEFWNVSDRSGPYTNEEIRHFMEDCMDLQKTGQLRWIITDQDDEPLGALDIFDYDPKTKTAALGILIAAPGDRKKGYATAALTKLLSIYKKEKSIETFRSLVY
jgi:diamine N-acetyltransferase